MTEPKRHAFHRADSGGDVCRWCGEPFKPGHLDDYTERAERAYAARVTEPTENAVEAARTDAYQQWFWAGTGSPVRRGSTDPYDVFRDGWDARDAVERSKVQPESALRVAALELRRVCFEHYSFIEHWDDEGYQGDKNGYDEYTAMMRPLWLALDAALDGAQVDGQSCNACVLTDEVASLRAQLDALKRYEPSETDIASFATTSIPDEPFRPIVTTPAPGGHDATT